MTVISAPGDVRPTRSESVHPPPRAPLPIQNPPRRPVRAASEFVDQTGRRNLSSSETGPGAEGVDTITGDMMKYLTRRPDLCLHQLSPGLCILFAACSTRPRPSIGPTIQPASHFRSPDVSPERPPGQWQPSSFTAPSQRPVLPRVRPPPSKSQAEDPLLRAAEMFSNPTSGSDSNKPAAPSGASVADLQKTRAPKTPPKHPASEASCCSSGHFS